MKFETKTREQILAGHPNCFAIPHVSIDDPKSCTSCSSRQPCFAVSSQILLAKRSGLLEGKVLPSPQYSLDDEIQITRQVMRNVEPGPILVRCNFAALPELYTRAMLAYANRAPELTDDEMIAELHSFIATEEAHENDAHSTKIRAPMHPTSSPNQEVPTEMKVDDVKSPVVPDANCRVQMPVDPVLANAAGAASTSPASVAVVPEYAFPAPDISPYSHHSNVALVNEIKMLIERGGLTTDTWNYDLVREEICAVHIEMNLRQQHAPRFRPQPKLPRKAGSRDEKNLACDR